MSCLLYYRQAQLHANLPNFILAGVNFFVTLDVILNIAFETYTLHLVATWPNTCDSCAYVPRNTFGHLELFVLITYRYPSFWVLPKRCSETHFDTCIRFCFYKAIRTLCLRKTFVATEMKFRTFASTDPMQYKKVFFDRLYRSLYQIYIFTSSQSFISE